MANTIAQNPTVATYSNATSVAVTFGAGCTNPSLIVAAVTCDNVAPTVTVSDDGNVGDYAADVEATVASFTGKAGIYSKQNTQTSALTVTAALGASTNAGTLKIWEITGAPTSSALDATGADTEESGGIDELLDASLITNSANCSIFAVTINYPGGVAGLDSGFTQSFAEVGLYNYYHFCEHLADAGAAGAETVTMGGGLHNAGARVSAAYKTAPAGNNSIIVNTEEFRRW